MSLNLQIIGILIRTVLRLGFAVQSSGKKDVEEGVGELRKWVQSWARDWYPRGLNAAAGFFGKIAAASPQ